MVQEYDEASRGKELPEAVEKQATFVMYTLGKMGAMGASQIMKPPSKPLGNMSPISPLKGGSNKIQGPTPPPAPGDYKGSFLEGSSDMAQRASGDKINAGESLTMPT